MYMYVSCIRHPWTYFQACIIMKSVVSSQSLVDMHVRMSHPEVSVAMLCSPEADTVCVVFIHVAPPIGLW